MTPELQSNIAIWRQKAAEGTPTLEDMQEAIKALRAGRRSAADSATKRKAVVKAAIPSADDMLAELGG